MAVTLKLSRQDAKYLVALLDAVASATAVVEPREPQSWWTRFPGTKAAAVETVKRTLDAFVPVEHAQSVACDVVAAIEPMLPTTVSNDFLVRGQRLMNGLPFSEWKTDHRFALRVGAVLQSGINIADERNAG